MVDDPADYPYSSHLIYLGRDTASWVTSEFGLSLFSSDLHQARQSYQHFMSQSCNGDIENAVHPKDTRIMGDDHFINKIPVIRYQPPSNLTLDQLAARLCDELGNVDVEYIRSSSRARHLTPIRVALLQQAVQLRVATLTEVANFLHRDPSALSKLINRHSLAKRQ
jgi:putative transposase